MVHYDVSLNAFCRHFIRHLSFLFPVQQEIISFLLHYCQVQKSPNWQDFSPDLRLKALSFARFVYISPQLLPQLDGNYLANPACLLNRCTLSHPIQSGAESSRQQTVIDLSEYHLDCGKEDKWSKFKHVWSLDTSAAYPSPDFSYFQGKALHCRCLPSGLIQLAVTALYCYIVHERACIVGRPVLRMGICLIMRMGYRLYKQKCRLYTFKGVCTWVSSCPDCSEWLLYRHPRQPTFEAPLVWYLPWIWRQVKTVTLIMIEAGKGWWALAKKHSSLSCGRMFLYLFNPL